MKNILEMLIVVSLFLTTCNLQAQIKNNDQKTTTETMPTSRMKSGEIATNMQKMGNVSRETTDQTNSRKKIIREDEKVENTNVVTNQKDQTGRCPKPNDTDVSSDIDSLLRDAIGDRNLKIILNAKTIRLYEVESFVSDERGTENFLSFKILQERTLDEKQGEAISDLITSNNTYCSGKLAKQCLFMPKIGIEFISGKQSAKILVSFSCDMVRFYHDEAVFKTLNSDVGHKEILAFYESIFQETAINLKDMSLSVNTKPIYYVAENGDSLSKIATEASQTYNMKVTTTMLQEWNNYSNPNKLNIGDKIIVGYEKAD